MSHRGKGALVLASIVLAASLWTAGLLARGSRRDRWPSGSETSGTGISRSGPRAGRARPGTSNGAGPIEIADGATLLSSGDSFDDFASLAQTRDGTLYAAYAAFYDGYDQVRLHRRLADGRWSARGYVPLARSRADVWMPQLAVDGRDRVWVVWSEQTGREDGRTGNWDLYARALDGDRWGSLVRLTDDPGPDIHHHVTTDGRGGIYVVWQAHPGSDGDIRLARFDGERWREPIAVTTGAASDWFPQAAVDERGVVWVVFDSYRNGDYDVFLTRVEGREVGPAVPVAASGYYEAHATVACEGSRVWIAWERGGYKWGKDRGEWLRDRNAPQGALLGGQRTIEVAVYQDGVPRSAPSIADVLPGGAKRASVAMPSLMAGADGRIWLRFRRKSAKRTGERHGRGGPAEKIRLPYWTECVSHLAAFGWSPAHELPASAGRISVWSRLLVDEAGSPYLAYSGDRLVSGNSQTFHDAVLVAQLAAPRSAVPSRPPLTPYRPPAAPRGEPAWDAKREAAQVAAVRADRVRAADRAYRILRGDLHRHSELSWDVGPGADGSFLDFYRYALDVAALDFASLTDHQGERHNEYHWWLTGKSADMFYLPPRFVPIYGYERSVGYPHGHRNVYHETRDVPVFPLQMRLDRAGFYGADGARYALANDTPLLYEHLHGTDGLAISHTSATAHMGTDWRDHDPLVEPVVEIYQGARRSSESFDGPRAFDPDKERFPSPDLVGLGTVRHAWELGHRLGVIASSDHQSTHIGYAMVLVPEPRRDDPASDPRRQIFEALRSRRTYAATDNIVVEALANGRPMGAELDLDDRPELTLRVRGTAPIARVELLRDGQVIHRVEPGTAEVELRYVDTTPARGRRYYYFRIVQADGEVAWTSPFWIDVRTEIGGQAATAVSSSKP